MGTIAGEDDLGIPPTVPPAGQGPETAMPMDVFQAYPPPREAWYTVGVLALATTFAMLDQGILGLLIQRIIEDFSLTDTQASLLLGPAFAFVYVVVGIPLSPLIDRWTRKKIIAIGITVWSLATAACGLAGNFIQLFTARMVVGAGEAVNGPTAYSIVSDCFSRKDLPKAIYGLQIGSVAGSGLSLLLGGAMIYIITTLGTPTLPFVGTLRPWQTVMMAVGLPGLLVALLLLTVKEPARRTFRADVSKVPVVGAVKYMWLHFAVFGPLFVGLTLGALDGGGRAWGAAFFERTYGWQPSTYGLAAGVVSIVAMLGGLFIGSRWVDRMQAAGMVDAPFRVIVYTRMLNIPFAIAMPLMPTPELALACNAVGFLTLGMSGPMLNAVMLIVTPNQIRGQVMALYLFIFTVVGQGLSPVITGATTDYLFTSPEDLRWSIMLLHLVFLPAALVVTLVGWKPYREAVQRLNDDDARTGANN
ncbi:MFS transporter [Altererythrobacter sp. B11]|uniref:MFS transporter n=1 Tax=Altererythrobacter sp. B11 TaxID=2060312 RepID=UPI000DC73BF9|nr:MFS transporter [Altererythrobacter sp. B11]BBC72545.1 MFS transporter [Altererythrobacter sp. B11]